MIIFDKDTGYLRPWHKEGRYPSTDADEGRDCAEEGPCQRA